MFLTSSRQVRQSGIRFKLEKESDQTTSTQHTVDRTMRLLFALAFALCCLTSQAADDEFYRLFLSLVDTNDTSPRAISSPLLVDTNNTEPKLTNVMDLEKFLAEGQAGDLRLGMTMGEIKTRWGKPQRFRSNCGGGPLLGYNEISLVFQNNGLQTVYLPKTFQFNHGLSMKSNVKDWIRILGEPARRTGSPLHIYYWYATPRAVLFLNFDSDGATAFAPRLEVPRTGYPPKEK
jgi:hypothetical protein